MASPFFASAYMRLLYRFLQLDEEQEAALFAGTGVDAGQLLAGGSEIPFAAQMQICRNALAVGGPDLGLRVGAQLQLAAHGPLGTALQHAPTLRDALETFGAFGAARASFFSLELEQQGDEGRLHLRLSSLDEDLLAYFTESILCSLHHCILLYCGATQGIKRMTVAYAAPAWAAAYSDHFAAPVTFAETSTTIHLPGEILALGAPEPDARVYADSVERCRREVGRHAEPALVAGEVERFLWAHGGSLWSAEAVARALHTSKRTLLRKLALEGTSFRALRDGVLRAQAETSLITRGVAETAQALGYAEESSFRRAFRRWTGQGPAEYRHSLVRDGRE